jgi:Mg-chelatase subunit ChlD
VGYGTGIERDNMMLVAGIASRYREAPDPNALIRVYQGLIREVQTTVTGSLIIDDLMGPRIRFVPGSSRPAALEQDDTLQWGLPILPRSGITLTYTVRPLSIGILPTNLWASARLKADGGINETFTFPIPLIEVIAPSPTPTATPTSTPTPSIFRAYLPTLLRERCDPDTLANDVVLVLDASTSMLDLGRDGRSKMEAAKGAIGLFLERLDLNAGSSGKGIDRAALVSFNQEARLAHRLSDDRASLMAALGAIGNAPSTRIDLGIAAAMEELDGQRRRPNAGRVIVLLTDGRANPMPIEVAEARAAEAKAKGITIYTIGLGREVEAEALARIASRPENFFAAAGPEALDAIYGQIALSLPCPKEAFWGGR